MLDVEILGKSLGFLKLRLLMYSNSMLPLPQISVGLHIVGLLPKDSSR